MAQWIKLEFSMSSSNVTSSIQVLAVGLLIQLSANAPGKVADDGLNT